ncbi:MAG: hypothetical protein HYS59_02225 [Candidatus Vogelbacteria bacterium]|nr:hypothetical protein [Candidatus Vogelbacteria bacterium]
MYVVTVLPIARNLQAEQLSYFSASKLEAGILVRVPVRHGIIPAIVVSSTVARDAKTAIKSSVFPLREVHNSSGISIFQHAFIEAAQRIARFHAGTTGETIASLIPKDILSCTEDIADMIPSDLPRTCIIAATAEIARDIANGFDPSSTVLITNGLPKRRMLAACKRAQTDATIQRIVMTPGFLFLPLPTIRDMIIHDPEHSAYVLRRRPYINTAHFAALYAKERAITITSMPPHATYQQGRKIEVVAMKLEADPRVSAASIERLNRAAVTRERTLVFTLRRGLATQTICADCATVVSCSDCGSSLILQTNAGTRIYRCRTCRIERTPTDACARCGGWRLIELGIAAEGLEAALKSRYPARPIFRLDADNAPSEHAAREIVQSFEASADGILVCTEIALGKIKAMVPVVIVGSLDSLLFVPDYRSSDRAMRLLTAASALCSRSLLVQTRIPDHPVFRFFSSGDRVGFAAWDAENRRRFSYPPYGVLIRLIGHRDNITALEQELSRYEPIVYDSLHANRNELALLIKMLPESWNAETNTYDNTIECALARLPRSVRAEVNPASLQ